MYTPNNTHMCIPLHAMFNTSTITTTYNNKNEQIMECNKLYQYNNIYHGDTHCIVIIGKFYMQNYHHNN